MKTLLVIPCYCERKRLPAFLPGLCEAIGESNEAIDVLLVDDGSPEPEQAALVEIAREHQAEYEFVKPPLILAQNQGKGGAVRSGWDTGADYNQLAFVDADGAVSASETIRVLKGSHSDAMTIAIRDSTASRALDRDWSRQFVSRVFNWVIRFRYDIQVVDTQCGLKIIPGEFYRSARSEFKQCGYAFDLELLLVAKRSNVHIRTIPIDWKEIPGSTTNWKSALRFLKQILSGGI